MTENSVQGEGNWTIEDCNEGHMFICEKPEGDYNLFQCMYNMPFAFYVSYLDFASNTGH